MKTLNINFVLLFLLPTFLFAQDMSEPKDIGVSEYDNFKGSSFDIMRESNTLKESLTTIDEEVKTYSGVMNTITVDKLKTNYKALKEGGEAIAILTDRLSKLSGQSQDVLAKAKNMQPKMKSIGAVKNTNASINALDASKTTLADIKTLVDDNIKILSEELKSRGELIE